MTYKAITLVACIFCLLIASCDTRREDPENQGKQYVDINGLIMSQVKYFSDEKATLVKTALVDGEEKSDTFQPDSTGWARELGFFRQIDMNKPAYRLAYDSTVTTEDGLTKITYDARFPDEVPVRKLTVIFSDREEGQIQRLEAEFLQENQMYTTFRRMEADFDRAKNNGLPGRLNHYYLEGGHKIIFRDSITYRIEGNIR